MFHREMSQAPTPLPIPQRPYDVSRGQNRYVADGITCFCHELDSFLTK